MSGGWDVNTDLVDDWIRGLDQSSFERVLAAIEYLAENGPTTGRPFVDKVSKSKHKNMKELRPQGDSDSRGAYRLLFAFDLDAKAIILLAGDKAGDWNKWYVKNIPIADSRLTAHQEAIRQRRLTEAAVTTKTKKSQQRSKK